MSLSLNELSENNEALIKDIKLDGLMRERLLSLGFTRNTIVKKIKNGSRNSIAIYLIRDIMVALRKEEANCILVS